MFIYHFNRLIRNRILWGFFAIIIALAFVAVDSCYRNVPDARPVGKLNGKKIHSQRFDQVVRSLRGVGRGRDNDTPAHVIDRRAWEQIAAAENAVNNGMKTTVPEIQAALRAARYQQALRRYHSRNIRPHTLEAGDLVL